MKIPASVTKIHKEAFYDIMWGTVKSVTVDSKNKKFSSEGGVLFNKAKTKLIFYPGGLEAEKYVVPSGVKTIGNSAFEKANKKLISVVLPKSVTKIGKCAFRDSCEEVTILNKNCKIELSKKDVEVEEEPIAPDYSPWGGWLSEICIYGYKGSTAEQYVKKWHKYTKKYYFYNPYVMYFEEFDVNDCDHQYKKQLQKQLVMPMVSLQKNVPSVVMWTRRYYIRQKKYYYLLQNLRIQDRQLNP